MFFLEKRTAKRIRNRIAIIFLEIEWHKYFLEIEWHKYFLEIEWQSSFF